MGLHERQRPKRSNAAAGISGIALGALVALGFAASGSTGHGQAGQLVQSTGAYAYTSSTSISKHYDADVQAGDLLSVSVSYDAAGHASVSDTLDNVWSLDQNQHGASADRALEVFHAVAKSDGDDTVKVDFDGSKANRYLAISEYSAGTVESTPPPTTNPPTSEAPPATTAPPKTTPPSSSNPPPAQTGFPGASNTGVPAGVTLHSCTYSKSVTSYDACKFSGGISISANNVTISRSLIQGQVKNNAVGTVISDTEINCNCGTTSNQTPPAVSFDGFTLERDNIHGSGHGVQIDGDAVVKDSWIHGLCCSGNQAHADGIISNGNDGSVTIDHNNVDGAGAYMSGALGLFGDFSPIQNWTITDNLFNTTGSYCLYGGDESDKKFPNAKNVVVTGNHFGTEYNSKCGIYGPVADFGGSGSSWSGNVWDSTNAAINP